ncbi:retinol dehydrogenase 14-like isoform X2 [Tribolium madens]|nr:retinol dehydrogenase 14-like isoform X2 [Tribolium madens]XP_044266815.1 retinol dehydrogenase 14-like isoform X2 [Tribolium madens]
MVVSDLYLSWPVVQTLTCAALAAILIVKLYNFLTCRYYTGIAKMDGKTVIITGGNGGIGKETAREIAKRGARVILACRNLETAKKARDEIVQDSNNQNVIVKKLDLSSQKSIREFAEEITRSEPRLDVLIHNAGMAANKIQMTEDNIELTMATNHFGPFLLTHLLIDLLKKSAPSRVVVVASELYRIVSLNLNNVNPTRSWFVPRLYYVSKYANICFTKELARRLEGTGVTANCLHPGIVDTGIWESAPVLFRWLLRLVIKGFFKTPVQGCQTSVYVACAEELQEVTGKYFAECKEKEVTRGASDENKAKKLWEISERLANLRPSDPKI